MFCADVKGDLSGLVAGGRGRRTSSSSAPRRSASRSRLRVRGLPGHLLGPLRRAGPSGPRDGVARWGRCCCRGCSTSTTRRKACSTSPSGSPTRRACCCSTSRICRRCSSTSPSTPSESADALRQCHQGHRSARSSARCWCSSSRARESFFGEPALDDHRPHAHRRATGAAAINVLAADKLMKNAAALRDVPALAAVGAVRGAAGGRRPGQAEARLLLRRGASAVQRRAEGAAREGRAGRAADPLEGRRRLFRHAEPARRAGHRAGPARQPRPARAARLHAARAEGGARRRPRPSAPTRISTAEAITQLGIGEALVSTLEDKGMPSIVQRTLIRPPRRASGRSRRGARRGHGGEPGRRLYDEAARPRIRPSRCCRRRLPTGSGRSKRPRRRRVLTWTLPDFLMVASSRGAACVYREVEEDSRARR